MADNPETQIAVLQTQMDNLNEKLDGISKQLTDFINKADDKYAAKWSEKAWVYFFAVLGGTFLLALIYVAFRSGYKP